MLLPFVLVLSGATQASPVGVFRSNDRLLQIALIQEEQFRVRPWGQLGPGVGARQGTPGSLALDTGEVLEFSDDFARFTARSKSELFGEVRSTQTFTRLPAPELEALEKTVDPEQEARTILKFLHVAEMSYFAESDKFSADAKTIGFLPETCADGSRAKAGKGEIAGCRYVLRIEVLGAGVTGQYLGTAFAVVPGPKNRTLTISSAQRGSVPRGTIRVEE